MPFLFRCSPDPEYDTKRARRDELDRELARLHTEVPRSRVGWNGTRSHDEKIAQYRTEHAAALAAAGER